MSIRNILYYGHEAGRPASIPLRAGPWSLNFQDGDLRRLALGGSEVILHIYIAVRGENWQTLPRTIEESQIDARARSFSIVCDCSSRQGETDFRWRLHAEGNEDGVISYAFDGIALSTFSANRVGLCVLHPIEQWRGKKLTVTTIDGCTEQHQPPNEIAPLPLFTDAAEISYALDASSQVKICLSGDAFEGEDQRNWTDLSYKTYSRPLRLPRPYIIASGSSIAQVARITVDNPPAPRPSHQSQAISFQITETTGHALPQIGFGFCPETQLSPDDLTRLKHLRPAFLSVDCHSPDEVRSAASQSKKLNIPLEVRGTAPLNNSLHQSLDGVPVCRRLIDASLNASPPLLNRAETFIGSSHGFVQINRDRKIAEQGDGVWFPIHPQVHASDHDSLIENLGAQAAVVEAARQLTKSGRVAVSGVTLSAPDRQNPTADPRQWSLFGAAWTIGSLKYLAEGRAHSVSYFETIGPRGLMPGNASHAHPLPQELAGACVYPMYHVFADIAELGEPELWLSKSTHPRAVDGIVLRSGSRLRVLLANFTEEKQLVSLITETACKWTSDRTLDETNCVMAMEHPDTWRALPPQAIGNHRAIEIAPLAILRIDGTIGRPPETAR